MTREQMREIESMVERGELGCGPKTAALMRELLAHVRQLQLAEFGAVSVACDALGISADAVRETAWSRARDTFPSMARKQRPA